MAKPKNSASCSYWWCKKPYYSGGYCLRHYRKYQRNNYGDMPLNLDAAALMGWVEKATGVLQDVLRIEKGHDACPFCLHFPYHSGDCVVVRTIEDLINQQ